uniref:Uncharacterized protein n=1 Tax=Strombidium inclinatum TaxID=197538 RepID=A0A7S3IIX0_9SPIT
MRFVDHLHVDQRQLEFFLLTQHHFIGCSLLAGFHFFDYFHTLLYMSNVWAFPHVNGEPISEPELQFLEGREPLFVLVLLPQPEIVHFLGFFEHLQIQFFHEATALQSGLQIINRLGPLFITAVVLQEDGLSMFQLTEFDHQLLQSLAALRRVLLAVGVGLGLLVNALVEIHNFGSIILGFGAQ